MSTTPQRRPLRDIVGWNHRATIYYTAVGVTCIVLSKVHP